MFAEVPVRARSSLDGLLRLAWPLHGWCCAPLESVRARDAAASLAAQTLLELPGLGFCVEHWDLLCLFLSGLCCSFCTDATPLRMVIWLVLHCWLLALCCEMFSDFCLPFSSIQSISWCLLCSDNEQLAAERKRLGEKQGLLQQIQDANVSTCFGVAPKALFFLQSAAVVGCLCCSVGSFTNMN
jgi:hypothetical protein